MGSNPPTDPPDTPREDQDSKRPDASQTKESGDAEQLVQGKKQRDARRSLDIAASRMSGTDREKGLALCEGTACGNRKTQQGQRKDGGPEHHGLGNSHLRHFAVLALHDFRGIRVGYFSASRGTIFLANFLQSKSRLFVASQPPMMPRIIPDKTSSGQWEPV